MIHFAGYLQLTDSIVSQLHSRKEEICLAILGPPGFVEALSQSLGVAEWKEMQGKPQAFSQRNSEAWRSLERVLGGPGPAACPLSMTALGSACEELTYRQTVLWSEVIEVRAALLPAVEDRNRGKAAGSAEELSRASR